ncbi:MAG: penicillin acylase family protein, partial [Pseudomonadota bacterium]
GVGGSNNWAVSGPKAGKPAAIVTNDPHLDSRNLPGPWHPVGLITPETRVVGVSTGLPGVVVGRNSHVAFGVTNAYADAIDLYVETIDPNDPDRYLEGDQSIPFEKVQEVIRIKSDDADGGYKDETLIVRLTKRGPVITDHDSEKGGGSVLSMRWASVDYMGPDLGLDAIMTATNIDEAIAAVQEVRAVSLNFVVGDLDGRIARRASGVAPIRLRGDGMSPFPIVDGVDNWAGRIPADEMPGEIDPANGWTGSANHMTAPSDYPYIYTTYASPSYRYRRVRELMAEPDITAKDAWLAQYDTMNIFARRLAPIFTDALRQSEDSSLIEVADILSEWDYRDEVAAVAPTVFQELVRQLAQAIFEDELGPKVTSAFLSSWYVWQERFDAIVQAGSSPWIDDKRTEETEDLTSLIHRAAKNAIDRLESTHGANRTNWRWGNVHQVSFVGPLRLTGFAGKLTGNHDISMPGSGETLMRALYPFNDPFGPRWFASLRMTADLNDPEKVRAVLPGGVVGRTFHPNLNDQTRPWTDKDAATYWWFSDEAIEANAKDTLTLVPNR